MLLNARQRRVYVLTMADKNKKLRREQLLEKYHNIGFDGLTEHERLELLLTYAQVDEPAVLTAELLGEYGSVNALADADTALLMKDKRINEQTAVLLRLIPCISRSLYSERFTIKTLSSSKSAIDYFSSHFIGAVGEKLIMTAVSSRFRICSTKLLAFGTASRVSSSYRDIAEFAIKSDCDIFFVAHNHPRGDVFQFQIVDLQGFALGGFFFLGRVTLFVLSRQFVHMVLDLSDVGLHQRGLVIEFHTTHFDPFQQKFLAEQGLHAHIHMKMAQFDCVRRRISLRISYDEIFDRQRPFKRIESDMFYLHRHTGDQRSGMVDPIPDDEWKGQQQNDQKDNNDTDHDSGDLQTFFAIEFHNIFSSLCGYKKRPEPFRQMIPGVIERSLQ